MVNQIHYDIDKDISIYITMERNDYHFSIYNDRNDKSVSVKTTPDKIKGLADFLNQSIDNYR